MRELEEMDRDELEEHAQRLEYENEMLTSGLEMAIDHIAGSDAETEAVERKLKSTLEESETPGIESRIDEIQEAEKALAELEDTLEDGIGSFEDVAYDD